MPIKVKVYDPIPLAYTQIKAGQAVTGISVSVSVINAVTGATLLASTAMTETPSGSGNYLYNWNPGITVQTVCLVTYTANSLVSRDYLTIDDTIKQIQQEEGRVT